MNSIDAFHRFCSKTVERFDEAAAFCAEIDATRERLAIIIRKPIDVSHRHESLAKVMAALDMGFDGPGDIDPVIVPWLAAHSVGSTVQMADAAGFFIRGKEPDSPVAARCAEFMRRYQPIRQKVVIHMMGLDL